MKASQDKVSTGAITSLISAFCTSSLVDSHCFESMGPSRSCS